MVGYAAVSPMLLLLPGVLGFMLGGPLGGVFGLESDRAADVGATVLTFLVGPLLIYGMARDVWARLFSEVRLNDERVEFGRLGQTFSWPLDELRGLRVTSQSTTVYNVDVTEVAICLLGPDGRRLHLTDLDAETSRLLIERATEGVATGMKARLEAETLAFGPTLRSHLNIYSLGPPLFAVAILAAFGLAAVGVLLSIAYFAYLYSVARKSRVVVSSGGLRQEGDSLELPWGKVQSATADFSTVDIVTTAGTWSVITPDDALPLAALINRCCQETGQVHAAEEVEPRQSS